MTCTTTKTKLLLTSGLLAAILPNTALAGYTVNTSDDASITFGGFIAADVKHVNGDLAPTFGDFWIGSASQTDTASTKFSVASSRFNTKYVNGDTSAFVEIDFYTGGGNEILTNSINPRLRHAIIKHGNWTVGQTWSTFINTGALAEAVDFAGPLVASGFVRQTQVRYTNGNFQFALENPESYGGDNTQDALPDVIGKYTHSGDWGTVSVSGVFKQLNTTGGESETAIGVGVTGKIKVGDRDDFRFQLHGGNTGRYVGAAASTDLTGEEVESSTSILVAYRHFWNDTYRSNVFYGNTTTEESDRDRTHWGVNLFRSVNKNLTAGFEVGNFEMAEVDANSTYIQAQLKYAL
ncbi:MAG: hypothetical protein HWE10_11370 [Gammaproteobacteria bacterium]|nr:hypothetical protein [Gammaproteobacteria bacterium]